MFEIPMNNGGARVGGVSKVRTWAGNLVRAQERSTHHLHLYAFPCDKCNGPVIVGSLGTRVDDLSQETAISQIGAVCLVCGYRPETITGPSVGHSFRPVEWEWTIRRPATAADADGDSLAEELSQDADTRG
ncbi:MAG TPA: hypothetical protein VHA33_29490 [Candidatus Angelobacter sp.]|jgi:hypothetical protein|nr:hypothetical protein [Candidatus Angelobacter sp.]